MTPRVFLGKVARAVHRRFAVSPARLPEKIAGIYQRVLGRQPNEDEIAHWRFFIEHGATFDTVKNTLHASYEHELKRTNDRRRLVELERFKMYVDAYDYDVGGPILNTGQYEPHVTAALLNVLKRGDTFLDVGANIGYFSLLAASVVGASGKVISFEPNVSNMRLLHASVVINAFAQVEAYPLAVSDAKGLLKMQAFGSNGFLDAAPADPSNFQFVQTVLLDDLLENEPRIDVVKIDIEGYEPLALKGMKQLIMRHRPTLFIEFNAYHLRHRSGSEPEEFLKQLFELDLRLSILSPTGGSAPAPSDVGAIMRLLRHETDYLDLMAQPAPVPHADAPPRTADSRTTS